MKNKNPNTIDSILDRSKKSRIIDVSGFELDDNGARKVAKHVSTDRILKKLNLQWNSIWPDGAQAIAHALVTNSTLEELYLGHNDIKTLGAQCIAEAIRSNRTLKVLDLCDNDIDDAGATSILAALEDNFTLVSVELTGNPIMDKTIKERLQEFMYRNRIQSKIAAAVSQTDAPLVPNKVQQELEEQKAQNNRLKKNIEKLTKENKAFKTKSDAQANAAHTAMAQLEASLKERIALEKQVQTLIRQLDKEKAQAQEAVEALKSNERLLAENQRMREQVNALNTQQRTLRVENDALCKQISKLSGSEVVCGNLDLASLAELEERMEAALRSVKFIRLQRLSRKVEELQDSKKCKVCFEMIGGFGSYSLRASHFMPSMQ